MPALSARLRIAFVSLAATVFTMAAAAQGDSPGDYAYRIPLSASGTQAVVQLQLPRAVYLEARTADLRDLRVFDAAGTALPFALFEPAAQAREMRSKAPVAVFPVRAPAGASSASSRLPDGLQIRTDASGAVISVTAPPARTPGEVLGSLVLDLHGAGPAARDAGPVGALVLSLPPGMNSYGARLALEASDDLASWETLVETSVSWLDNGQGASVRKDRIEFAPHTFRFARIRWLEGTPVEFGAIHAERITQLRTAAQSDSVVLQPKAGTMGQDLLYEAPIAVPADAVGLELHGQNVVLPALIGHYRKVPGTAPGTRADNLAAVQLQPVANATFFQLMQDGQRRASGDIDIAPTHAAQWVVRPQAKGADRPGLRLRWTPARMVFLAGGKGPYTLAFGHSGVESNQVPLSQVAPGFSMRELAALEGAKAGEPVRQDGAGGNAGDEAAAAGKQSLWLWALLVAGVAALGLMAWKLSRQLKEGGPDQPAA